MLNNKVINTRNDTATVWKKITFNAQSIQSESDKAILIKMPSKSLYAGYVFWHPKKLVQKKSKNGKLMSFVYGDDFMFNLKKYGKGKSNKFKVLDEMNISAISMESAYKGAM